MAKRSSSETTSSHQTGPLEAGPVGQGTAVLPGLSAGAFAALGLILAVLVWSYGGSLMSLATRWVREPDYSHGFFVPVFAAYLLWRRRSMLQTQSLPGGSRLGLVALAVGAAMRIAAAAYGHELLTVVSLVPVLAGLVLVLGGVAMFRWAWPGIFFLVFMVPLPGFVAQQLHGPLQRIATIGGVYLLQTLGIAAVGQGNVILLPHGPLGIAEACAGLRMLNLFLAFCVGACFLIDRPLWEKALIVASAGVIGILANIVRIVATGLVYELIDPELATKAFHDFAGLILMPAAVLLVSLEIYLLGKILVPQQAASRVAADLMQAGSH